MSWRARWSWRTRAPVVAEPWCPGWALGSRGPHDGLSLWTLKGKRQIKSVTNAKTDVTAPEFRSRRSPADPVFQPFLGGLALLRIVGRNSRRRALPSRPSRRRHHVRPSVRSVGGGVERHETGFTTASSADQNLLPSTCRYQNWSLFLQKQGG